MQVETVTRVTLQTSQAVALTVTMPETEVGATDSKTGERFIVRFDNPNRLYHAVVTLGENVGIDLMNG